MLGFQEDASSKYPSKKHELNALRSFQEEFPKTESILVYRGNKRYQTEDGIKILPAKVFCQILYQRKED